MSIVVQILGGSHDGAEYALPAGTRELRLARLLPFNPFVDNDVTELTFATEIYGPATEADYVLKRWSLLRVEE